MLSDYLYFLYNFSVFVEHTRFPEEVAEASQIFLQDVLPIDYLAMRNTADVTG
jgi:hypothetical protein